MQISTWRLNKYILKPPMTHSSWHLAFNWFCYASCQIHPVNIHRMVLCLHCDNVITWGPLYWHGLALIPAWISNHMASKVCDEIIYPFPNVNRWSFVMVSSHTLLSKWLLIHVGIKLKHVSKRGALFFIWLMMASWNGNFCALPAICAGNSPVPGDFPTQGPVRRSFGVFFDLRLNKRLSKQSWGWWFETPSRPLWRHRNVLQNTKKREQDTEFLGCSIQLRVNR